MSIKAHLLAHLKKEDEKLYPVLRKEAEDNERLKNTIDLFALDMENVSSVVQKLFDKYSEGTFDEEFPAEFESLSAALSARIKNEEDALYEEYEGIYS
jgi:iron-sulfur cluster repair protein YtfE (RIC family)